MHLNGLFLYIQSHLILYLSSFALCRINKTLAAPPINSEIPTPTVIFDPPRWSNRDFIMHFSDVPNSSVNTRTHTEFLNLSSFLLEKRIIIMARKFVVYFLPATLLLINFLCYLFFGWKAGRVHNIISQALVEVGKKTNIHCALRRLQIPNRQSNCHSHVSSRALITRHWTFLITKSTAVFLKPTIVLI